MALQKLLVTAGTPLVVAILYLLFVGYKRRTYINKLHRAGMPMPADWNWWTGHLAVLGRYLERLPPDADVYYAMDGLVRDHSESEMFLMDYWPVFEPVLMIFSPEIAVQCSNKYVLQKQAGKGYENSFKPIVGGPSLLTMNDDIWKTWRTLFNSGFSAANMQELIPSVVNSVERFCDELKKREGDLFSLTELTTRLTMEIIAKVTLDTDLDNQREEHPLSKALNTILAWHSFWDPRILLNPLRIPVQTYYSKYMDTFIRAELEKRFTEMKQQSTAPADKPKHAKSVIAIALNDYITQKSQRAECAVEDLALDDSFASIAANQIRTFIFAGNDSTSASLVYIYYMLSKHPEVLSRLREEHDQIFGPVSSTSTTLKENPALLNKCVYTTAVIKETLRLYPPASSLRQGVPGVSITDQAGNTHPTERLNATLMHRFIHRNPRIWPRPLEFLPERWLVEPGHDLYVSPNSGAWRPFEAGPRNCIGQTLVYNEMKIVMLLTARKFDIVPAYGEWDALQAAREGVVSKMMRTVGLKGETVKTVNGERAYQTNKSGAHPADGYPCRVSLAHKV